MKGIIYSVTLWAEICVLSQASRISRCSIKSDGWMPACMCEGIPGIVFLVIIIFWLLVCYHFLTAKLEEKPRLRWRRWNFNSADCNPHPFTCKNDWLHWRCLEQRSWQLQRAQASPVETKRIAPGHLFLSAGQICSAVLGSGLLL